MTVSLFTHPDCEKHVMPGHPERPERLASVMVRLKASGLLQEMRSIEATEITRGALTLAHPEDYVTQILAMEPHDGLQQVEVDTYMSTGSSRAARLAAGANLAATRAVLEGECQRAFCAVRPPGHHAEIAAAMGFCLFNNVAIAAEFALAQPGIKRVVILDFDVHHCNGTVDIFKDRDEVLVCSSFQDNFYPNRYLDYTNPHIVNTPLAAGDGSSTFRSAIENDWLPAIELHKPDLFLVSAGFDAHVADPLGQIELVDDDYYWVTRQIVDLANDHSKGRIVSTLEGGYDLDALSAGVEQHVRALIA